MLFSSQLLHLWASPLSSLRARRSTNRLRWKDVGRPPPNVSPSGIWKQAWQTGHLIVVSNFLLAYLACLSIHRRQNECKHGSVLGSLTVSRHSGHSASFLRFVNSCWTSMPGWKSWELAECGWHVTSLIIHKTRPRGGISLLMSLHPLRPIQIYMCSLWSLSMSYSFCF